MIEGGKARQKEGKERSKEAGKDRTRKDKMGGGNKNIGEGNER